MKKIFVIAILILIAANGCTALAPGGFKNGAVVTADPIASKVGIDIMKAGGNAIDAAVAISYTLAVTHPSAGNLGGGCFIVIRTPDGKTTAINAREKAPHLAHRDMYLDKDRNVDHLKSMEGALASGVPGTVAGTLLALEKYGTMTRQQILTPAIELAENGYHIKKNMDNPKLTLFESTRKVFLKPNGQFYQKGDRFIQKDLAKTLKLIVEKGRDGFYKGTTADKLVKTMKEYNGIISAKDLADYVANQCQPVIGNYRGYEIISMPPPSSGGITLIELLNILERFDLKSTGFNTPKTVHIMVEAEKLAFADRSEFIADPDFFDVPIETLTSKKYADLRVKNINIEKPTPSKDIKPGNANVTIYESNETTHYCVVDKSGMAVAVTTTLNGGYGCGLTVDGAGFLLNNEMDDFSAKPGYPNSDGLVYGEANAIAPGKRMLSSMSPTIVLKDSKLFMVVGAMGGPTIITSVAQTIINVIDHDMPIDKAVAAKRFHNQWLPDVIHPDSGWPDMFSKKTKGELIARGYEFGLPKGGKAQAILVDQEKELLFGGPDPRGDGSFVAGY